MVLKGKKKLENIWPIERPDGTTRYAFARGFEFGAVQDLKHVADVLGEGVTICSSKYVAGPNHVHDVLVQACEYWSRNERLARNASIDLLMRISCQSQISKAIELSEVSHTKEIALFGLVDEGSAIETSSSLLSSKGWVRDDFLLELDSSKEKFLRNFHGLGRCARDQVPALLAERSVLLVFSR